MSNAEQAAWDRARRPKRCKLAANRVLARLVAGKDTETVINALIMPWLDYSTNDPEKR